MYLSGFLWSPIEKYWPNIIRKISKSYQITFVEKYKFHTHKGLQNMVIRLYKYDNVSMKRVKNNKLRTFAKYPPVCMSFQIYIPKPHISKGKRDTIEKHVVSLKRKIRKKYKSKIDDYVFDVIIHISDNPKQTKFIDDIINKAIIYD